MSDVEVTRKITNFIPRTPKEVATLVVTKGLEFALSSAPIIGDDIEGAIRALLRKVRERETAREKAA